MSIWDSYAEYVYRIATGGKRRRIIAAPLLGILYVGMIVLFIFASLWIDNWLAFPHFHFYWWSIGLSVIILIPACLFWAWTVISFLRARGTPVPLNPPSKLITSGLYAYIRNPMLLGLFLLMLGLGILFGSLSLIFIFTPLFILLNVLYIKAIEEKEMEKKFSEEYLEYRKRVPMFIPRLTIHK